MFGLLRSVFRSAHMLWSVLPITQSHRPIIQYDMSGQTLLFIGIVKMKSIEILELWSWSCMLEQNLKVLVFLIGLGWSSQSLADIISSIAATAMHI